MPFTLQILHASDLEGGLDAIENAPNFAAVVDALQRDAADSGTASILLSAGDNYIPGPFFNAGGDSGLAATYEGFYNSFFGLIDTGMLAADADTNGDGFFDNDEIQAQITAGAVTFDDVYTTDVNGDGFADYFEEIDTASGRLDVAVMNAMGFDATAVGNHEFDGGTDAFENIINYDSEEGNSLSAGRYGSTNYLQEVDTPGAQFPYLSANLDFSQDFDVGALFTSEIQPTSAFASDLLSARVNPADPTEQAPDSNDRKIAPASIIEIEGEQIGIVGATTQLLASISSPGLIDDVSSPGTNDMASLATVLQPVIDSVIAGADGTAGTEDDINKIVLVSHLQQFALEEELAGLLSGVDVIIAGGSDTLNADAQDRLRPGDTADRDYPVVTADADGNNTLIVSTDGEYSYVGRLVVEFDDDGLVMVDSIDPEVSGAFATDTQGVLDVTGAATLEEAIAGSEMASNVQNLTNAVTGVVTALDGDIAGQSDVFLNGVREAVRTEETNFGNLTADANLAAAQAVDPDVLVSIKNGGGIRASIGELVDNGDGTSSRLPTAANPLSGKDAGEISELDIDNALRFDNGLSIVELTPAQLKIILEHAVAATEEGATPGQFAQVGGLRFSFDPTGDAQEINDDGMITTLGTRVQNVVLIDENGETTQRIITDGEVADGAPASIKAVTLDFLANGGDGYPFDLFTAATPLEIGEQQALSDFLTNNFPEDGETAFDAADTSAVNDTRIQNLAVREDTVDPDPAMELSISEIQGAGHISAFEGELVLTSGIVTAIDGAGFYVQDPDGDGDDATSDAIFVFTGFGNTDVVSIGDAITVEGTVGEFIPGGASSGNLSTTQISDATINVTSSGNALPAATLLGGAGRTPPADVVISDSELPVNLQEDPGTFNPDTDGIDFFESLEGMLVAVDAPTAVSATNRFGETWVVADDGAGVTSPTGGLNDRGGLNINADADGTGDLNPEKIQIQYDRDLLPEGFEQFDMFVGDFLSNITGVVDYGFGNYEVRVTDVFGIEAPTTNTRETTALSGGEGRLSVATYNVFNVTSAPDDGDADQIAELGQHIATNLGAPDILALQEIQDNSGVADDGTLDADETLQAIVDAIEAAGGPSYSFVSAIVDEDGENGGVPGGNIRNAFLYNPDRVDMKEVTTLESDKLAEFGVTNPDAFDGTRDPLLGTFTFEGEDITLINNHFSSRFGSTPVFGAVQPFVQAGEAEREQQALTLNEVVDAILADDPDANISVLGDLNTFEFTDELAEDLPGTGADKVLTNLIEKMEGDEAYTFNFQGNSQSLDHIFVTEGLLEEVEVDVVHVNVDFADAASDHEPIVATFMLGQDADMTLIGGNGRDLLEGGNGDDGLVGLRGRDTLLGNEGDDDLFGGGGRDSLDGGEGDDHLFGGRGRDVLLGGLGDDYIEGNGGADTLIGGEGDDRMVGGRGADVFIFEDSFGHDTIFDFNAARDALDFVGVDSDALTFTQTYRGVEITVEGAAEGSVLMLGLTEDDLAFV